MTTHAIDDLLSVDTLTGMIRTFVDQAENRSCSGLFARAARPLLPMGESVTWDETEFSRHLAPVSGQDSPHTRARRLGRRKRSSTMAMVKLYKDLPSSHLFLQRAPGSSLADAEGVLSAELEDLANLLANTKEFLACGALLGKIEVNQRTVPGSDVEFLVEFGNAEASAVDSWADDTTQIRSSELIRLKRLFKDQAGMRADIGITEPGVEGYLVQNNEIREFAKESLGGVILNNLNLHGVNPAWERLAGLRWSFTDGVYKPEGQPVARYFPEDTVLVLPAEQRLQQVLGWAEGKVFVPAGPVISSAQAATGFIQELRGFYAYAEVRTDPVGIRIYAGWYGLPVVLNPNAVLVFKVVPPAGGGAGATP
ncbi:MAG: major capsid protein [Planctomycetes bacterium]|nr:major capsid protein [Planctomycetota bacterium]